eukprot:m.494611 g.494611  ORF g.494611 m.494611 type:complete len:531 (+) comp41329_c0_seq1:89-1681(+)
MGKKARRTQLRREQGAQDDASDQQQLLQQRQQQKQKQQHSQKQRRQKGRSKRGDDKPPTNVNAGSPSSDGTVTRHHRPLDVPFAPEAGAALVHPAAKYTFEELRSHLDALAATKAVVKRVCPRHGKLALYSYQSLLSARWGEPGMCIARGIVLDLEAGHIAALPFEKFFNHDEYAPSRWPGVSSVQVKHDGSLGIAYYDHRLEAWRMNTRGSFGSPQAQWGEAQLHALLAQASSGQQSAAEPLVDTELTLLFELVYEGSKVVVQYEQDFLCLLAAYHTPTFRELPRSEVETLGARLGCRVVEQHANLTTVAKVRETLGTLQGASQEGWVVKFNNGSRRKFKAESYLCLHRLCTDVTPQRVHGTMATCRSQTEARAAVAALKEVVAEEHSRLVEAWATEMLADFGRLVELARRDAEATANLSANELALALKRPADMDVRFSLPHRARHVLFAAREEGRPSLGPRLGQGEELKQTTGEDQEEEPGAATGDGNGRQEGEQGLHQPDDEAWHALLWKFVAVPKAKATPAEAPDQ